ncbi:hypothetical protein K2173_012228 [Erythroxylum novogranatense]|uniref:glutathione transferase n=1 Tax=Erythroxylum novogranatense TaxID=1862640 RepID=A0AAV8T8M5_9ROSI|nr:hypothetical protein K2173_012228 [Erythroxylum novogranatense]
MAEQQVKLLGATYSPFVHRVEIALKLKGIEYESVEVDIVNKSPLLLQHNPIYKKVPVLVHSEKPIVESLIILEYIEETWKDNPIMPHDPYEKATARFWAKFIEEKLTEIVRNVLATEGELQEKMVLQAKEALQVLEGELKAKDKQFFGGESVGYVDIVLGYITLWLGTVEEVSGVKIHDPESYPLIGKWMKDFTELPFMKSNIIREREMLVHYLGKIRQFALAAAAGK